VYTRHTGDQNSESTEEEERMPHLMKFMSVVTHKQTKKMEKKKKERTLHLSVVTHKKTKTFDTRMASAVVL